MRIVKEAQAASIATSGVKAGGAVPDFLSEGEGEKLVESLVTAAETESAKDRQEPREAETIPSETSNVLSELLENHAPVERPAESAAKQPVPPPGDTGVAEAPKRADDVDRAMIDSLTDAAEEDHGG